MDEDVKSGLWGCGSLFFVAGVVLASCFQCAFDRAEQEKGDFRFECGPSPEMRAKDTRRTTPQEKPMGSAYEWRNRRRGSDEPRWKREGYDSFEDWYYAVMDVVGEGEYPDM